MCIYPVLATSSAGAVDHTNCISSEGYKTPPPMGVLDMTLNDLITRLQS